MDLATIHTMLRALDKILILYMWWFSLGVNCVIVCDLTSRFLPVIEFSKFRHNAFTPMSYVIYA